MFKSLFGSDKKKPLVEVKEHSIDEIEALIKETLTAYRSVTFPYGALSACLDFTLNKEKAGYQLSLSLPFPCYSELGEVIKGLSEQLSLDIALKFTLSVQAVRGHSFSHIKNIIAISSGKGGVGKSTTAVNLAYALIAEGAKVGILDADIYGPSIPTMLGLSGAKPSSKDGKLMQPLEAYGLKAMSIGFLVPEDDATVWRGPMASSALNQLLNETDWPELDYLIVDMPPGTGDIQLTLAQKVPVAASVVVTTPQNIALADAVKGIAMFNKVKVPVLGVIENMSYHICQQCGDQAFIFGQDGAQDVAESYQVPLLGQLPLDINIRADADLGHNLIAENSSGEIAQTYRRIARHMTAQLFYQLDMRSEQTPEIIIEE